MKAGINKERGDFPVAIAVVAILLLVGGGAAAWYLTRSRPPTIEAPAASEEAKQYVRNLKLTGVELKATDSYMSQRVVEILGNIKNDGSRAVKLVEISCIFYDPYGQLVLRERLPIVKAPLAPGAQKPFRLPFDNLPGSWNQRLPQIVIAKIEFD